MQSCQVVSRHFNDIMMSVACAAGGYRTKKKKKTFLPEATEEVRRRTTVDIHPISTLLTTLRRSKKPKSDFRPQVEQTGSVVDVHLMTMMLMLTCFLSFWGYSYQYLSEGSHSNASSQLWFLEF